MFLDSLSLNLFYKKRNTYQKSLGPKKVKRQDGGFLVSGERAPCLTEDLEVHKVDVRFVFLCLFFCPPVEKKNSSERTSRCVMVKNG